LAIEQAKPVRFVGSSQKDLRSFPKLVRVAVGHAIYAAQKGETDPAAKPLKGFGGGSVLEIVTDHPSSAQPQRKAELIMEAKAPKKNLATGVTEGSRNVFADLGLPNAEQELVKAQLTLQIYRIIKQRGITQAETAKALGIKQPHVSLLMRNRAGTFSVGRLMEFLTALGHDVEVTIRPTRREHGGMSVTLG
jgi:predicted XRE-type DNA-binding protein